MFDAAPAVPGSPEPPGSSRPAHRPPLWLRPGRRDPEVERAFRLAHHAAALTRLAGRIESLLARGGRDGQHLRAASTAYDQTLILAAGDAGLDTDLHAPLLPLDRLTLEAELALAGLRWTHVGSR